MNLSVRAIVLALCLLFASCAPSLKTVGGVIDKIPYWAGGEPEGIPPRAGTPEYDAYLAKKMQEAAEPKVQKPAAK
jgi:hypothetical protein